MEEQVDKCRDDCPLVERIPGKVSGATVLKGTRLPADALTGSTPGGADTIHTLLAYQKAHLHQMQS